VALCVAPSAHAFCRATTVPAPPDFEPASKCWDEGKPLYWANACVGYSMNAAASRQIPLADASSFVARAFETWTTAACPAGEPPSVGVYELGTTTTDRAEYNVNGPNANVIVFHDSALPHHDVGTVALPTLTFDPDTGEIYDADVEINTSEVQFSFTDVVPQDGVDFATIMAYEAGRFLGLANTSAKNATEGAMMNGAYSPGSSNRTLSADDIAGVCSVYPPDFTRATAAGIVPRGFCDPTPRHGLDTGAPPEGTIRHGCSVGAGGRTDGHVTLALVVLCAGVLRRTARRGRSSRPIQCRRPPPRRPP
jgi:hypothetical protein